MTGQNVKIARIYKIICNLNGKVYIGWTINGVRRRWHGHVAQAKRNSNFLLHKAIRKYGKEHFVVEEMYATKDINYAKEMETFFIKECQSILPNGYNMTEGGEGTLGYRFSEDAKRRIGLVHKGKPKSLEQRKKMSNARLGWKPSDETRSKMSAAKLGKKLTAEHVQKLADAHRGQKRTPEQNANRKAWWTPERRAAASDRFSKMPRTEEHKRKISESLRKLKSS